MNTATYKIFQAIECLQNFLEYDGSRDAHLNVSKWRQRFSIIMNCIMDSRFELQWKVVAEL